MLHVGLTLDFDVVEEVLMATLIELERNSHKLIFPGPKDDVEPLKVRKTMNVHSSLVSCFIYRVCPQNW